MKALFKSIAFVTAAAAMIYMFGGDTVAAHHGIAEFSTAVFATAGLRRMNYGGALDAGKQPVTYHSYVTNDTLATVLGAGYFNNAFGRVVKEDLIEVHYDLGGSPGVKRLRVSAVDTVAKTVAVSSSPGAAIDGVAGGYKLARGQATTATANDTIVTGLATVVAVIATLNDVPAIGVTLVTADIGDQNGAPAAGSFLLKTWKPTATGDGTPIAATTFSKKVNWVAIGT